ncbi:uncharacterized protein LOC114304938 [Camellia sinensis]|uniref:uncharacterized protein LOC114304938 n=1 Tax=Camellia sinensis TaxID=4442 RepID=UPI0010368F46|nr:uncharacterized protein LOC114304938 [Camellia sinensis]
MHSVFSMKKELGDIAYFLVKPSVPPNAALPFSDPALYRSIVGALTISHHYQPDLSLSVNQACQHMHAPTLEHFAAVKRILRYEMFLIEINDWLLCFLGVQFGLLVCQKQATASRSSTEAEYRALAKYRC